MYLFTEANATQKNLNDILPLPFSVFTYSDVGVTSR